MLSHPRPQRYKHFHLHEGDISNTIKQCLKMIEYAEWLAKEAEDELMHYGEFVRWVRGGESLVELCLPLFLLRSLFDARFPEDGCISARA